MISSRFRPMNTKAAVVFLKHLKYFTRPSHIAWLIKVGPSFRKMVIRTIIDDLWKVFPLANHLRWRISRGLWHLGFISSFAKLATDRIKYGECFVVESGFCCDTGSFANECRYTNAWAAMKSLYYCNTTEWSDGPSSAYVGDGWMWENQTHYSQAPGGWDALRADREAEEDERWERRLMEGA